MTTREPSWSVEAVAHGAHDAVRCDVIVVPRAARSRIVGLHGARLKVTLAAAPVDGEANEELCATLAKALGVPKRAVHITQGAHNKHKTVVIHGVTREAVLALAAESAS